MAISTNSCGWTVAKLLDSCMGHSEKGQPGSEASLFEKEEGVEGAHYAGGWGWGTHDKTGWMWTQLSSSVWGSASQDGRVMTCGWCMSLFVSMGTAWAGWWWKLFGPSWRLRINTLGIQSCLNSTLWPASFSYLSFCLSKFKLIKCYLLSMVMWDDIIHLLYSSLLLGCCFSLLLLYLFIIFRNRKVKR